MTSCFCLSLSLQKLSGPSALGGPPQPSPYLPIAIEPLDDLTRLGVTLSGIGATQGVKVKGSTMWAQEKRLKAQQIKTAGQGLAFLQLNGGVTQFKILSEKKKSCSKHVSRLVFFKIARFRPFYGEVQNINALERNLNMNGQPKL